MPEASFNIRSACCSLDLIFSFFEVYVYLQKIDIEMHIVEYQNNKW